ncbi:isoprenoid synthase domain-containing protein [Amylocarpus encephaloides]|uniref:Terpene synthase n=1 Tax=Amylocarpus encephaloides TaxID=45428 RepID=A0A9P7YGU6_9HELO|nr:isoprenoid synthase domain-containing protein [Amylocarpus encephaloides]
MTIITGEVSQLETDASEFAVEHERLTTLGLIERTKDQTDARGIIPKSRQELLATRFSARGGILPAGKIIVTIPDMFVSFLSTRPKFNPFYHEVKKEADAWIERQLQADEKVSKKIIRADFALFCAIASPEASRERLRTLCDWGNWVFPFDDMFDSGHLKDDRRRCQDILSALLHRQDLEPSALKGNINLVRVHNDVWNRVVVQDRFSAAMSRYCEGVLEHVGHASQGTTPELEEYISVRRRGVGVEPVLALVQYAECIDVTDAAFEHHSVQELQRVVTDVIFLQNDILSYSKEEARPRIPKSCYRDEGVPHNIIMVFRSQGCTTQEAYDKAGDMLKDCYRDWYLTQAALPQYGEAMDAEIQRYIKALQNVMTASLHWHFKSDRYFGNMKDFARKYQMIIVADQFDNIVTGELKGAAPTRHAYLTAILAWMFDCGIPKPLCVAFQRSKVWWQSFSWMSLGRFESMLASMFKKRKEL